MSIFRVAKTGNYTILLNETLRDANLSLGSVGLLARLLTRPQDWQVHFEALRRENGLGRDKLRRLLRELEKAGYLVRRRIHRDDGRFIWVSEIHEKPQTIDVKAAGGKTIDGKAVDGKPADIQSTDKQKTELKKHTTTTKVPRGKFPGLIMPVGMSATEIEQAHRILEPVKQDAQMLLDVLHAAICAGDIRKSRLAYLRALVKRFKQNEFDPTPGLHIEEARWQGQHQCAAQNLSTEKILRQHARMIGRNEDDYLQQHLAGHAPASQVLPGLSEEAGS